MKKTQKINILIISLLATLLVAPNIVNALETIPPLPSEEGTSLKVAVSVLPQTEWVQEIGGDNVEVMALIPAGASPATHQPDDRELTYIAETDVWFQIGLIPFDKAHKDALIENGKNGMEIINLSIGIDLLVMEYEHEHDDEHEDGPNAANDDAPNTDPHIWNSPTRVIQMVQKINETLSSLDPDNAEEYSSNTEAYIQKLTVLNTSIVGYMSEVQNKHMLIFHPSWGYFADDFGITMIALEDEGKDPSSEHFAEIVDLAKEKEIGVIFTQTQFSEIQAKAFAEEACVESIQIDPLAPNYIENMNNTAQIIAEKLDQKPDCDAAIPGFSLLPLFIISIISLIALFSYTNSKKFGMN